VDRTANPFAPLVIASNRFGSYSTNSIGASVRRRPWTLV
jgi:hypothetical protein